MPPAPRGAASGQTWPCPECDKIFSRKEYMARHHRSKHSKEKPFGCEHCQHAFSRSDLLRRHYKTCNQAKAAREGRDDSGSSASPASDSPPIASTSAMSLDVLPPPDSLSTETIPVYSGNAASENTLPAPPSQFHLVHVPAQYGAESGASFPQHNAQNVRFFASPSLSQSSHSPVSFGDVSGSPYSVPTTATTAASSPENLSRPDPALSLPDVLASITATTAPPRHSVQPVPTSAPIPPMPGLAVDEQNQPYSQSASAFKHGVAQHDTLAPGLSRTGSFTRDEVLASEVLQDLMRTPFGNPGSIPTSPGFPWHGAKAAQRAEEQPDTAAANEAVALVDSSGSDWAFTSFGGGAVGTYGGFGGVSVSNKLEETPAAQQLAEYFNKGGVGGITALDLGFPTEPCLFPDWLINPKPTALDDNKKWWIPEQKFCLGYLYPWHVPPLPILSSYARKATEQLLADIPVLHGPSTIMNELPTHTAFALTVAGGAYEPEGQSFSNEMLVEKRVFLVRGFQEGEKSWKDKFASLQSLLLYQLLGLFHRDEQQRLLSQSFHSALVYMFRALDLPRHVAQAEVIKATSAWQGDELERKWKAWIELETCRRVCFIIFLIDLEHAAATNSPQLLSLSDLNIDLPANERTWKAETAAEWVERSEAAFYADSISFLTAIRALLSPTPPDPFSSTGILLTELTRLSPFPLLILSRTLSYLERKTEEALAQVDPFRQMLGGLGVYEGRESENRAVLERIRRGREILRRLPGGIARGGGESWFNEVIPSSAKNFVPAEPDSTRVPRRSGSTSTTSASDSTFSSPSTVPSSLEELLAEFDEQPYMPFAGEGGAHPGETYEQAQERLRKHAERRVRELKQMVPEVFAPP